MDAKFHYWVRPDPEDVENTPKRMRHIQNDSGIFDLSAHSSAARSPFPVEPASEGFRFVRGHQHHPVGLHRQVSNIELSTHLHYSSTSFAPRTPLKSPLIRSSPLKSIQNCPKVFLKKTEPIKLRKCHTDPYFCALVAELKKETGMTPRIPEKKENPFEPENLADAMKSSWTSPTMFASVPEEPSEFRWDVDHLANLQPVDIEKHDILRTEFLKHVHDDSDEETAQENIKTFFNGICDVPSPNSHELKNSSLFGILDSDEESTTYERPNRKNVEPKEVECQTEIHIPPNFDFDRHFADFKINLEKTRRGNEAGVAGKDDVRRKLFLEDEEFEEEECELNVSRGFEFHCDQTSLPRRSSGIFMELHFDNEDLESISSESRDEDV